MEISINRIVDQSNNRSIVKSTNQKIDKTENRKVNLLLCTITSVKLYHVKIDNEHCIYNMKYIIYNFVLVYSLLDIFVLLASLLKKGIVGRTKKANNSSTL